MEEGKVIIKLQRDYAQMLLNKISTDFNAQGVEGAKALIAICEAFKLALDNE